jgi:hypothetical protein
MMLHKDTFMHYAEGIYRFVRHNNSMLCLSNQDKGQENGKTWREEKIFHYECNKAQTAVFKDSVRTAL